MSDSHDALEDAGREELLDLIEEQRRRLGFYADVLLSLGFEADELMGAVD